MQCLSPVESEVLNVVLAAEIVPDRMDDTQLLQALETLFGGNATNNQNVEVLRLQHKTVAGGNGGPSVSGSWQDRNINYEEENSIVDASTDIANDQFVLGAGTYVVDFVQQFHKTGVTRSRLQSVAGDPVTIDSTTGHGGSTGQNSFMLGAFGRIMTLTQATTFKLQYLCSDDRVTNGLGVGDPDSGLPDIHMECSIRRIG
ncbi:MAG: hypothetical protein KTR23_08870 [Rhodospirillales bacterium]|nr:hypothetical protein [Rhodospirillales bacterium]